MSALRWLKVQDFVDAITKGEDVADVAVLKGYVPDQIKSEGTREQRKFTFVISTGAVDRDGDTVAVDGWHLDAFRKAGGPVLFGHKQDVPPVARTPWIGAQDSVLKVRTEFTPRGVYPFGDLIGDLVDFGSLKATSVGFKPRPGAFGPREGGRMAFKEQDLLEYSIVPIPSNPEALLEAKAAGIVLDPYIDWCERALAEVKGPGLWLPKGQVEAVLKLTTGNPASVVVPDMGEGSTPGAPEGDPALSTVHAAPGEEPLEKGDGFMGACAECGQKKPKGKKCAKCGSMKDKSVEEIVLKADDDEGWEDEPYTESELPTPTESEIAAASELLTTLGVEDDDFDKAVGGVEKCGLRKGKGGYQVTSKKKGKGKTIGKHKSKKDALAQIAAIQASKGRRGKAGEPDVEKGRGFKIGVMTSRGRRFVSPKPLAGRRGRGGSQVGHPFRGNQYTGGIRSAQRFTKQWGAAGHFAQTLRDRQLSRDGRLGLNRVLPDVKRELRSEIGGALEQARYWRGEASGMTGANKKRAKRRSNEFRAYAIGIRQHAKSYKLWKEEDDLIVKADLPPDETWPVETETVGNVVDEVLDETIAESMAEDGDGETKGLEWEMENAPKPVGYAELRVREEEQAQSSKLTYGLASTLQQAIRSIILGIEDDDDAEDALLDSCEDFIEEILDYRASLRPEEGEGGEEGKAALATIEKVFGEEMIALPHVETSPEVKLPDAEELVVVPVSDDAVMHDIIRSEFGMSPEEFRAALGEQFRKELAHRRMIETGRLPD